MSPEPLEPRELSPLARRLAQLSDRQQKFVVAFHLHPGLRVEDLAEAEGCSVRTVKRERERANRVLAAESRLCGCGCGLELPVTATPRRRYLNAAHRLRAWRKRAGVKRIAGRGSYPRSESSERSPAAMSTPALKSMTEIVQAAVAEGRAKPSDSVADVLEAEGYIAKLVWPTEHSVDTHPGRVGKATSYIACEPLTLADEEGKSRELGVGDVLDASEVRAAGTALAGLASRHQVLAVPSYTGGVVGWVSLLRQRVARLEQELAAARAERS